MEIKKIKIDHLNGTKVGLSQSCRLGQIRTVKDGTKESCLRWDKRVIHGGWAKEGCQR